MHLIHHREFPTIAERLRDALINAPAVEVGEWQSKLGGAEATTVEVEDVSFSFDLPSSIESLQEIVQPNLPWADEHFTERVSGIPHNPPPSSERWPFKRNGHAEHLLGEKFAHTYPERLWPREVLADGIRFRPGDLDDVVNLLATRPTTRQAFIPIWFPEDTGAHHGERVPCTIGYHLMLRGEQLKIVYYMRSCDYLRHFRDDVYLAGRLCQWMCERVGFIRPGALVMHISSLHVFKNDVAGLVYRRRLGRI